MALTPPTPSSARLGQGRLIPAGSPVVDLLFGVLPALALGAYSLYAVYIALGSFRESSGTEALVLSGLILLSGLLGGFGCGSLIAVILRRAAVTPRQALVYGVGLVCGVVMAAILAVVALAGLVQGMQRTALPLAAAWPFALGLALCVSASAVAVRYIRLMGAIRRPL